MAEGSVTHRQQALIDQLFSNLPQDYPARHAQLLHVKNAVFEAMGKALEASMNEYLAAQRQQTLPERRELASELNDALRSLSLAIKCPRTGRPAILLVDTASDKRPDVSRFRLEVRGNPGERAQRTLTSLELPLPLELMPNAPRIENFSRHYKPPHR